MHVFAVRVKQAPPLPVEYVPERQLIQSPAASLPAGDEVPAAQEAVQAADSLICPVVEPNVPTAHNVHDD